MWFSLVLIFPFFFFIDFSRYLTEMLTKVNVFFYILKLLKIIKLVVPIIGNNKAIIISSMLYNRKIIITLMVLKN